MRNLTLTSLTALASHTALTSLTALALSLSISAALAQTPPASEETATLDTIIVTATKRAESIQTVGLSITAISGTELNERGTVEFQDFAISVPNLAFGATDDGVLANRTISIRGIEGLNTTGFYIDDIPLDESINPLVLDVERVEILRGPQGTLYGARGLGGTVRLITKQPQFDASSGRAHAGISYTQEGSLNYIADGAFNLPLAENTALRMTAYYQRESGIFDRIIGPVAVPGVVTSADSLGALVGDAPATLTDVDNKRTWGGQMALRWQPNDAFNAVARVFLQRTEIDGFPLADFVVDPAASGQIILTADDFTQERLFNIQESGNDQFAQFGLTLNYNTEFGAFTSSTGYFTRNTSEGEDTSEFISFTLLRDSLGLNAAAIPSPIFQKLDFRTFVQEARFVSDFDGPVQITTGAFYQKTDDNEDFNPPNLAEGFDAELSTQLNAGVSATGESGVGDLIFESNTDFAVTELGLYGELSYALTDRLSATIGMRYFDTSTEFRDMQSGYAVGGLNAVDIGPLTQSENGFNFKGLIEYEATDDVYLYASASEGFRIGGANGNLPSALGCPANLTPFGITVDQTRVYKSDSLWSYEGGIKSTFAGGRVRFNAAGFYVNFTDIQQRIFLSCGFDFISNIGSARSYGFELESIIQAGEDLTLQFAVGYTDAKFTETVPGLANEGDRLQQVPELTLSSSLDYARPITTQYEGFIRADFAYVGDSISRAVSSVNPRVRPSYEILNMRVGMRTDRYSLGLFVNNLFDKNAVLSDSRTLAAEVVGRPRVVRNRPRTFGIDLRANF